MPAIHTGSTQRTEQHKKKKKKKIWNTEEKRAAERKKALLLGVVWVAVRCCDLSGDDHHRERVEYMYAGILTFLLLFLLFSGERRAETSRGEFGLAFLEKPSLREIQKEKGSVFSGRLVYIVLLRTISSKFSNKPEEEEEMIFFPSQVWSPLLSI